MTITPALRVAATILGLTFGAAATAQTYVGNLDGTSVQSTFTTGIDGFQSITPFGWASVGVIPASVFGQSTNDALIASAGDGLSNYTVQYNTSTALVANSAYTLEFSMGFVSANTGSASYLFELGTWDGSTFNQLDFKVGTIDRSSGPTSGGSMGASVANLAPVSFLYTSGSSGLPTDPLMVRWSQTNTTGPSDYFGIDNVTLSVAAVPEPSTYATIAGVCALGLAAWRRRRTQVA